jgi:hypothetical protein
MKKFLTIAVFLLSVSSAHATTMFTIIFHENPTVEWTGTYTLNPLFGGFTMDAFIGDCADPDHCTYDLNIGGRGSVGIIAVSSNRDHHSLWHHRPSGLLSRYAHMVH